MEINQQKIEERAKKLGRAIGQSDRSKALERAEENLRDDEDTDELYERLSKLQQTALTSLQAGKELEEEKKQEIQELTKELERKPRFQQYMAAQTNFNNLIQQVNQYIQQGISEGQDSKIIEI